MAILTHENKHLLLIDLCARLPYGVMVQDRNGTHILTPGNTELGTEHIKPYLRPMSSMTEEECKEFNNLVGYEESGGFIRCSKLFGSFGVDLYSCSNVIDWLNAHHFDYRGLIEKGLALEAPEGMYKNK